MEFGSLEECIAHIESCMGKASSKMANESKKQAKQIIKGSLKGYSAGPSGYKYWFQGSTGQTENTPTVLDASSSGNTVSLENNGFWYSVITGTPFFSIDGLESGSTWGRGSANIMQNWESWCSGNLDRLFLESMRGQGVPIS